MEEQGWQVVCGETPLPAAQHPAEEPGPAGSAVPSSCSRSGGGSARTLPQKWQCSEAENGAHILLLRATAITCCF